MGIPDSIDPLTLIVLLASATIIVIVLFARFIKVALKIAIIGVMLLFILYFLRQAGIV